MTIRTSMAAAAVLAAVVRAGYVLLDRLVWHNRLPDGLIQANGRIEGGHVTVASKFPGRVVELAAGEGTEVLKGSILIRLDDAQTKAKVDQASRLVDSLLAQVEAAHTALAVQNLEVPLSIEAAAAKVDSARAVMRKAAPSSTRLAGTPSASALCFHSRRCRSSKWIKLMRVGQLPLPRSPWRKPPMITPARNWHRRNWGGNESGRKKRKSPRSSGSVTSGCDAGRGP